MHTYRDTRRNFVDTKHVQEKVYFELLVLLYMLFIYLFIHTRECDHSNQVGVEPFQSRNAQNIMYGEMTSYIIETYKSYVLPYCSNIHKTATDMARATICPFTHVRHGLPHRKCML